MSTVARRLVYLSIYVDRENPHLCKEQSSDQRTDGCPSFTRDGDGEAWCGAFGDYLVPADPESCDVEDLYNRATQCQNAQVAQEKESR
jgi:hypothetical protein